MVFYFSYGTILISSRYTQLFETQQSKRTISTRSQYICDIHFKGVHKYIIFYRINVDGYFYTDNRISFQQLLCFCSTYISYMFSNIIVSFCGRCLHDISCSNVNFDNTERKQRLFFCCICLSPHRHKSDFPVGLLKCVRQRLLLFHFVFIYLDYTETETENIKSILSICQLYVCVGIYIYIYRTAKKQFVKRVTHQCWETKLGHIELFESYDPAFLLSFSLWRHIVARVWNVKLL